MNKLLLIAVAIILVLSYLYVQERNKQPLVETITETIIDTVLVEQEIVIRDTFFVNKLDTLYVDNEIDEIVATGELLIDKNNLSGLLTIEYRYVSRKFTLISENLKYTGEIETETKIIKEIYSPPKKRFKPLFSASGMIGQNGYSLQLGAGVCLYEKLDLYLLADSNERIGFGISWRF